MRIAMIGQKGIPATSGGVERHTEELSKELAAMGHEVLVYARRWYSDPNLACDLEKNLPQGIKIIHTPSIHTKHLDAISHTFISTIHALFQKPTVIHFQGVGPALMSWIPRLFTPHTKVVVTFHSMDRYQHKWGLIARMFLRLGEKFACRFPHETIVISRGLYHYCLNQYQKTTTYIPNGVPNWDNINPQEKLEQWHLTPNQYLLTVSRIIKGKGIHYLISAFKTLQARFPQTVANLKLVIVGEGDENYLNELYALANGDTNIIFTGAQYCDSLKALYANATLFVHPSENEGLPLAVLEAMSYRKAVVASDIPAHEEILRNHHFCFETANINSLTEKLNEILSSPEMIKTAGEQNQKIVLENYSWQDIAKKIIAVYTK